MVEFAGISGGTTLGRVRKENQDRYLVAEVCTQNSDQGFTIALLGDGVGSLPQSGSAAAMAVTAMVLELAEIVESSPDVMNWPKALGEAATRANSRVIKHVGEEGASTLSLVVFPFKSPKAIALHLGDSKIYGVTWAAGFEQLSKDQTVGEQLNALGAPSGEEAGRDPRMDRSLAQYMGMQDTPLPQIFEIEAIWKSILLASDGVTDTIKGLTHSGWKQLEANAKDKPDFIKKLLFISNWLGGHDNCTAVITPVDRAQIPPVNTSSIKAVTGTKSINLVWQIAKQETPRAIEPQLQEEHRTKKKSRRHKNANERKNYITKSEGSSGESKNEIKTPATITFLPGLNKNPDVISDSK
jgi:serine/threonine protein phosphatase PrpC